MKTQSLHCSTLGTDNKDVFLFFAEVLSNVLACFVESQDDNWTLFAAILRQLSPLVGLALCFIL